MNDVESRLAIIQNSDGTNMEVNIITYLIRDDNAGAYLVYSKNEKVGEAGDEIIYISRIIPNGKEMQILEISDDVEWGEVQTLLKKIANA